MRKIICLLVITISIFSASSQELYDLIPPKNNYSKKCSDCFELINSTPREIQFNIYLVENTVFFYVNSVEWFEKMFKGKTDGLVIDVVSKSSFDCTIEKIKFDNVARGKLFPPIYSPELKEKMNITPNGEVFVPLFNIPDGQYDEDIEYNFWIVKKKNLCYYKSKLSVESYKWELVDMGFYLDTLTYNSKVNDELNSQERYLLKHKTLTFKISFEKNKSEYSVEDIKPLYDSLKLTNFDIKKITIRSYSSVEGKLERNIELQKKRSESIVDALQGFQHEGISNEIITSENWVEFLNDIAGTEFEYLSSLSKNEIKERLKDKKLAQAIEPYLKNHRKAVVVLELQKKDRYGSLKPNELVGAFNKSINDQNINQAIDIQNSIFEKIGTKELNPSTIDELKIPVQREFGLLLNKQTMFLHMLNEVEVYESYLKLEKLQNLLPKDGHIKYNMCALKFKIWLMGEQAIDPVQFKKEITALSRYGISTKLVKRMLINYNIIMSEHYMVNGDYANKDKCLRYIYSNYKYAPLTDIDYLNIAQYYSSYMKFDWATKILKYRVKKIDVDEDLLFYYLSLTLNDSKLTKRSEYRTIMLNAININSERFCSIFNSNNHGGASFQLLIDDYLRKTYCENCN